MTAEAEIAVFIDKFAPEMRELIRDCRSRMQELFPTAVQLVYDNFNFFVIGFGPTQRPSEAIFSLAADRRGVNLCFLQRAPELPDPKGLLRGTGKVVRNLPLRGAADLDTPEVQALIDSALQITKNPMDSSDHPEVIVKSVSVKQRPRQ